MSRQNERAIARCEAFMAKNREVSVGRIASILVGRGYSSDQICAAFTATFPTHPHHTDKEQAE